MAVRTLSVTALVALALVFTGCTGDDPGPAGPDFSAPTYYEDVRPILVQNCVMCHQQGGIGPFALETYADVIDVGERVRDATRDRIMPPFLATSDGSCGDFSNTRALTQAEIDTIGRWYTGGMLEGDSTIAAPQPRELPRLDRVDATLSLPEYGFQTGVEDDYRCFVVDLGTTRDMFLTGYEVRPGNTSRVHHVIVYNPLNAQQLANAEAADAMEPGPGYACYGGTTPSDSNTRQMAGQVQAMPVVLWAPGAGATRYPQGTGIQLAAGRRQIVQVHYNLLAGTGDTDRTEVDLQLAENALPGIMTMVADFNLNLPPRLESVDESDTWPLTRWFNSVPVSSARVWGVFPHMHTLGRSLNVTLNRPDGSQQCMVDIPRWDFNWQLGYFYSQGVRVNDTDSITITCNYNTMERSDTTNWGDGTMDEMCLSFAYVTP